MRAEPPPQDLWLIFDCSSLSIEELKIAYKLVKYTPWCEKELEQIRLIYSYKNQGLEMKKCIPLLIDSQNYYEKTPRKSELKVPEILKVFGKHEITQKTIPIPFMKKSKKTNLKKTSIYS